MDVKFSFLNRYFHEEVYVEKPKVLSDPYFSDHVYKLKKDIYGLKQASRAWYERVTEFLINHEYNRGGIEKTLFVKNDEGKFMVAHIYVDDLVFYGMSDKMVENFVQQMH